MKRLRLPQDYDGKTKEAYMNCIHQFNAWNAEEPITKERIRRYFSEIARKYRPATLQLHKIALKKCFARDDSYFWKTIKVGQPIRKPRSAMTLNAEEIKGLIKKTESDKAKSLFKFLYVTGARIEEALSVRVASCRNNSKSVVIDVTGKGRVEREVEIPENLFAEICEAFQSSEYLFENSRRGLPYTRKWAWEQFKKFGINIKRTDIHPHVMRHSIATRLLNEGENINTVANFLGHTSISTIIRYYHSNLSNNTRSKIYEEVV